MQALPQSRESREIFGETETMKIASRRDQSLGLDSRLQALHSPNQGYYIKREDKRPTVAIYGHGFPSIKNWRPFGSEQLQTNYTSKCSDFQKEID